MKQKLLFFYYKILGKLAKKYLVRHKSYVIGIHGSVGKTSCRTIIYQTIKHFLPNKKVYSSPRNFNGELGMSLSIFQIESSAPNIISLIKNMAIAIYKRYLGSKPYDIILLEYGIDRPGEMDFLLDIVKPHIGVITKLDAVHSLQFGSPKEIASEEIKMLKNTLDTVFINEEEPYAMQIKDELLIDTFSYQTVNKHSSADIRVTEKNISRENTTMQSEVKITIKNKNYQFRTNLLGYVHYGYIALGITIADILHYKFYQETLSVAWVRDSLMTYTLLPWRFQFLQGINDMIILDSTYNSAPLSVRKIIDTAQNIKHKLFKHYKTRMLLGEMRELGNESPTEHEALAEYIAKQNPDRLFIVGSEMEKYFLPKLLELGYDSSKLIYATKSPQIAENIKTLVEGDSEDKIFLIAKWSQNTIFLEEAVKLLLKDTGDADKLCRQSDWWIKNKEQFFN